MSNLNDKNITTAGGINELNFEIEEAGRFQPPAPLAFTTTAGIVEVKHSLGKKPQGWIPVYKDGDVNIWEAKESTKTSIFFSSSAAGRLVKIIVF